MHQIPHRVSLVDQVAALIREGIQTRRWKDRLPARRALSSELQVSRNTIDAALRILDTEELLQGVSRHRTRIKEGGILKSWESLPKVIYLDGRCLEEFSSSYLRAVLTFQIHVQAQGLGFLLQTNEPGHSIYSDSWLRNLIRQNSGCCWVLAAQPAKVQQFFKKSGAHTIVVGGLAKNVELPCIDLEWRATASHAVHRLLMLGYRRPMLLMPKRKSCDDEMMEAGFCEALQKSSSARANIAVHELSVDGVFRALARGFARTPDSDVIVCTSASSSLRALSYLSTQTSVRVSKDVSILSLEGDQFFDALQPAISYYWTDMHAYQRKLVQWVLRRHRLKSADRVGFSPVLVSHLSSRKSEK